MLRISPTRTNQQGLIITRLNVDCCSPKVEAYIAFYHLELKHRRWVMSRGQLTNTNLQLGFESVEHNY